MNHDERTKADQDLKDEIAFHLQEETRLRMERGEPADRARATALREFGNVPLVEEITRDVWSWTSRERLTHDLKFAWRTLTRDLSFAIVAIVTLALGIGATVTVFAIVNAVLLRPLPFPEPDRVVMVWERTPDGSPKNMVSTPNYLDWRARNQSFDHIGLISPIPLNISGRGDAEQVDGLRVTAEFFPALGVSPLIGRVIRSGEDVAGGFRSVVLTYKYWQRHFGGSSNALGQTVTINGLAHEIVGVMPPTFYFLPIGGFQSELYIPIQVNLAAPPLGRSMVTVARLKPGVTLQASQSDMERVAAQTAAERPQLNAGYSATVIPLMQQAVGDTQRLLWFLFASVACLLLLACANVANLLLMRATKRTSEMAVRMALGAGRWRLIHQLIVESLVLTAAAGAIGLAVAWIVVPLVPSLFPPSFPLPRGNEVSLDGTVVWFTLMIATGVGLVFGIVPAVRMSAVNLADPMRNTGRTVTGAHWRVRRGLVVAEIALALVLVLGAGLMSRSLLQLYQVRPGFDTEQVLSLRMLMVPAKYREPQQRVTFLRSVIDRIQSTPGVVRASSIHFLPLSGVGSSTRYFRADRPEPAREATEGAGGDVSIVSAGYFATMGIRLLQGRDFNERDRIDAPRVVIVNETLARSWFPEGSPIGKHLMLGWSSPKAVPFEIIGVAGDVRAGSIDRPPTPAGYLSHAQEPSSIATLVVRTTSSPSAMAPAVRAAIAAVDPDQGVSQVQTLENLVANTTARPQLQAIVFGAFGVLALLIASVGLYGVMAYAVEQRRREMGVRLALGAAPARLRLLIAREGLLLAGIGIALGGLMAFGASSTINDLLYETRATDPRVIGAVGTTLLLVAMLACLVPARRATRVDPITVLREQ